MDEFTESFGLQLRSSIAPSRVQLRYAHDMEPESIVSIPAAAEAARVGYRGQVIIHPTFGPWIAFRMLVLLEHDASTNHSKDNEATLRAELPPPCQDPRSEGSREAMEKAQQRALELLADSTYSGPTWPAWLAVREACDVGARWRYSEPQIRYHYQRDRSALWE